MGEACRNGQSEACRRQSLTNGTGQAGGWIILKASLITKDNAKHFYFKDSPF
jgi:hypothetical protein